MRSAGATEGADERPQASLAGTDGEVVSRQSLVVRGPRDDEEQSP